MAIDKDLDIAYNYLYESKNYELALKKYDEILKLSPNNLNANIYKSATLVKLYYDKFDWHNDTTLENSLNYLNNSLSIAKIKGKREDIGFVYFRFFIYHFNNKDYGKSDKYMQLCKEFNYNNDTLSIWETQLTIKINKILKKRNITLETFRIENSNELEKIDEKPTSISSLKPTPTIDLPKPEPLPVVSNDKPINDNINNNISKSKLRVDWYQSSNNVTLSLFTSNLPQSQDDIKCIVDPKDDASLSVSYNIAETGSEFQYSIKLSNTVDPQQIIINLLSKKIEIVFTKKDKKTWKTLEASKDDSTNDISNPYSSKKKIDWEKLDIDDNEPTEDEGSADAFFQKLYAGADPDMKRAMVKSFVESNGTTLNTNWSEVEQKKVETSPPEGMIEKKW